MNRTKIPILAVLALALSAPLPAIAAQVGEVPTSYDLRDPDSDGSRSDSVVTPVKLQDPWASCWSFSAIAAAETSILSEMGTSYASAGLDLSERATALASFTAVPESLSKCQAGEGFSGSANAGLNSGGKPFFAVVSFSAGLGPVSESTLPYRNNAGLITCLVLEDGAAEAKKLDLTDAQIAEYQDSGSKVTRLYYSGSLDGADWSADSSLWINSGYELEDGNALPSTWLSSDNEGEDAVWNQAGFDAIKSELLNGHAVAMDLYYSEDVFMNMKSWSYCSYGMSGGTHAACIVGWDDDYDSSNFKTGANGEKPAGNGAWLVKNSFGSQTEDFPNNADYGIVENGVSTGYFWLSYYDTSLGNEVSFDFDLSRTNSDEGRIVDQYDFLPDEGSGGDPSTDPLSSANIYTASDDMLLRAIGARTCAANTTVTFQVYLLDDEAKTPTDPGHATQVYSASKTFAYGGYHRFVLAENDRVAMRAGQRYAVVVTQVGEDGKYYQCYSTTMKASRLTAKVNAGESWTGALKSTTDAANGDTVWTDWVTTLVDLGYGYLTDNFAIKGISEAHGWASVAELSSLEQAISQAKERLAAAKISVDGSEVGENDSWMTQTEHDSLAVAVKVAEETLALAGNDYRSSLANTTPSSAEVESVIANLSVEAKRGKAAGAETAQRASEPSAREAVPGGNHQVPATGDTETGVAILTSAVAGAALLFVRRT